MPAKVYRFSELRRQALAAQRSVSFDRAGVLTHRQREILAEKNALTVDDIDVASYLLLSGVDLKGQMSMAYTASGGGISASASINPLGLVGLNTELDVGAGFKAAKQRSVIVMRGAKSVQLNGANFEVPRPIGITSPIGVYWEGSAQLGIDVSIGFEAKAGESANSSGTKGKAKAEGVDWEKFGEKDDEADTSTGYEMVAASFEAKAGFKAEYGYTYDHYYGEDPFVIFCKDQEETRVSLNQVLEEGSTKTAIKRKAIELINANSARFGGKTMSLHQSRLFGAVTTTTSRDEVLKVLMKYINKLPRGQIASAERAVAYLAINYAEMLLKYDLPWDSSSFLRLSSHKHEGKAGLYAGFEAKAHAMGIASVSAEAEVFAGMKGEYKRSYARFQTRSDTKPVANRDGSPGKPHTVFTTYDAAINYSSFSLGVDLDADVSGSIGPKKGSLKQTKPGKKVGEALETASDAMSKKPDSLNRMHYRCAIAVWQKPPPPRPGETPEVALLEGSGVAFGGSFVVENLCKLYEKLFDETAHAFKPEAETNDYVKIIADSLKLTPTQVLSFLSDHEVRAHIMFDLPLEMGVLFEATFAVPAGLTVPVTHGKHPMDKTIPLVQISKDMSELLFKNREEAQSIRLRHRKRDVKNKDASLFTVGFKVAGNGFKIKLDKVDRAGSDGMVDLRTVFLKSDGSANTLADSNPETRVQLYEAAVPAAALFCQ